MLGLPPRCVQVYLNYCHALTNGQLFCRLFCAEVEMEKWWKRQHVGRNHVSSFVPTVSCARSVYFEEQDLEECNQTHLGEWKVVVIGSGRKIMIVANNRGNVGKTTFVRQLHDAASYASRYLPTIGCEVRKLDIQLENGRLSLQMWDTAVCADGLYCSLHQGSEKFGCVRDGF